MHNGFHYKGFEVNHTIDAAAESVFRHLKKLVPNDSTLIARAEYDGFEYGCSVDIFLDNGSIFAFTTDTDPINAIGKAAREIEQKLAQAH